MNLSSIGGQHNLLFGYNMHCSLEPRRILVTDLSNIFSATFSAYRLPCCLHVPMYSRECGTRRL